MAIQRLLLATPSYKFMVSENHVGMSAQLMLASMATVQAERQGRRPGGRLVLPTTQRVAFEMVNRFGQSTCSIARNRNEFLYTALNHPHMRADWVLMVDADTWQIDPRPTLDMLAKGYFDNAAVIAAPVLRRDGKYNTIADGRYLKRAELAGKARPVERIGGAFMALNVGWFRQHWGKWDASNPWFDMVPTGTDRPDEIAEDYCVCDGVRKRGGVVLADGRFEPEHEGAPYAQAALNDLAAAILADADAMGAEAETKLSRTLAVMAERLEQIKTAKAA